MTMVKTLVALATERMLLKTSGPTFLKGIEFMYAAGLAPDRLSVMMTTSHKYVLQFHSKCDIRPFAANYPNFTRVLRGIVHVRAWRIKSIEFVNVAFHMRDVENLERAIDKLQVELVLLRNCTYPGVSRGDEAVKFLAALNRKKQAVVCEYGDDRLKHRITRRPGRVRRPSRNVDAIARLNAVNGDNMNELEQNPQGAPPQNPPPAPAQAQPAPPHPIPGLGRHNRVQIGGNFYEFRQLDANEGLPPLHFANIHHLAAHMQQHRNAQHVLHAPADQAEVQEPANAIPRPANPVAHQPLPAGAHPQPQLYVPRLHERLARYLPPRHRQPQPPQLRNQRHQLPAEYPNVPGRHAVPDMIFVGGVAFRRQDAPHVEDAPPPPQQPEVPIPDGESDNSEAEEGMELDEDARQDRDNVVPNDPEQDAQDDDDEDDEPAAEGDDEVAIVQDDEVNAVVVN